jgi:hypothetical protein
MNPSRTGKPGNTQKSYNIKSSYPQAKQSYQQYDILSYISITSVPLSTGYQQGYQQAKELSYQQATRGRDSQQQYCAFLYPSTVWVMITLGFHNAPYRNHQRNNL